MKREVVLFYMIHNKIHMYLVNSGKVVIEDIDNASFFKYGEISDVDSFSNFVVDLIENVNTGILRPNVVVLYNDVCNSDIRCLYSYALLPFNYAHISFVKLSDIIRGNVKYNNVYYYDGECYTNFKYNKKVSKLNIFNPIVIGTRSNKHIHYSDIDYVWNVFKGNYEDYVKNVYK